jgi:hypothetical protein
MSDPARGGGEQPPLLYTHEVSDGTDADAENLLKLT